MAKIDLLVAWPLLVTTEHSKHKSEDDWRFLSYKKESLESSREVRERASK
ncbi:hypothetical protein GUITHDRAFT_156110 [Guillardia theta CCMP2712]|uniref:Uncharacterized protein n=1 Tax=Guillardia theta (strain CCMP2712) TaxID=905079 RepID=L1IBG8_GUITC|nr:hypothetical protein GUITHDRAFT_156110 [Guillardia theta CCMP2712]EKX33259.1 hypothetical protein GUITHDRAFT_156110 [Guillardia theta CCMP2712]|eukprot:XP_005820239.1 hypothetical protein GUITHDRAFT_156110 [Guillardia theta CCMP2712]